MASPIVEFPNLALIRQGVDYRFKIRCRDLELMVRPLSISEEDQVASQVSEEISALPVPRQTSLRQSMQIAIKKLALAQTSAPGEPKIMPKVGETELAAMTAGEVDHLFKQYVAGSDKVNPVFDRLPAERVAEIVDTLKKNSTGMEMILIESSFFHLVDLSLHLLKQGESPTASSSG